MLHNIKRIRRLFIRDTPMGRLIRALGVMSLFFIVFAIFYRIFEGGSWNDAIWQAWQTQTTVGYGDGAAETIGGRISTIIIGTVGLAYLGFVISVVTEFIINRYQLRRRGFMRNPYRGSYLIFNNPGQAKLLMFIREIRSKEPNSSFCIVDESEKPLPEAILVESRVHYLRGSVLSQITYEKSRVHSAKAIIIFPQAPGMPHSDATTKVIIELIDKFTESSIPLIAALVDQQNRWMFNPAKVTLISESLEVFALVQECQDRFTGPMIEKLLLNSEGVNPSTVTPAKILGKTWKEIQIKTLAYNEETGKQCHILAVIRDGEGNICPDTNFVLRSGDLLSIAADHNTFDWKELESFLSS